MEWTPHSVGLAFVDVVPPTPPRPPWLLETVCLWEPLAVRRRLRPRGSPPQYELLTSSGRALGRVAGVPAEMIEFVLSLGATPRLTVGFASSALPPDEALQLVLEVDAWFPPGARLEIPVVYDARSVES